MEHWSTLLIEPPRVDDINVRVRWFVDMARRLLNGSALFIAGQRHRIVEVEIYYYAAIHPDPFAHRDPIQREPGRWYFHRSGNSYRGGSFKGFDLTFGDENSFSGILIRSIETATGILIDGPSLCVDHLLALTGTSSVATLDAAIAGRKTWDVTGPVFLEYEMLDKSRPVYNCPRVGLSLKRAAAFPDMPRYLFRPYRYLTEPRRIRKGKMPLALAMHAQGIDAEIIRRTTGCPAAALRRYIADYMAGRAETDWTGCMGRELGPRDWCRLFGSWMKERGERGA